MSSEAEVKVRAELFSLADESYREFNTGLIPTLEPDRIIGVRMPALRRLAKQLLREGGAADFLASRPHYYLEENHLHGLIVNGASDYQIAVDELAVFLPDVDNWATCDLLKPVSFAGRPTGLEEQAFEWMRSDHAYTVRFGVSVLRNFFLGEGFRTEQLDAAAEVPAGDYYVEMAVAWYVATALADHWDQAVTYLEDRRLPRATHLRAIRKGCESRLISPEQKAYLRTLR